MTKPKTHLAGYAGRASCGYERDNVTHDLSRVTCELCVKPKIPNEKMPGNIKEMPDDKFLRWIHARLKDWHGDDQALYHMRRLQRMAKELEKQRRKGHGLSTISGY